MNVSTQVSVFIPCLIDQVYPEMGMAMVAVLRRLGFEPSYDRRQTCCGQPAFNAGHRDEAREVGRCFLDVFEGAETIVCPSGSCTAMVSEYFPVIFENEPEQAAAAAIGGRMAEFSDFLCRSGAVDRIGGTASGTVALHNSCHSYRELRLEDQAERVARRIEGCTWAQPEGEPVCCGFGGLFSIKYAPVAGAMAEKRLEAFTENHVDTLISNDPGCIMHMRHEAEALGLSMNIVHLSEFLDTAMSAADSPVESSESRR